jgi:hypothetical protein
MKKLLVSFAMIAAVLSVSGCSVKTVKPAKTSPVCVGCENLPDCVPGPLGDCIKK